MNMNSIMTIPLTHVHTQTHTTKYNRILEASLGRFAGSLYADMHMHTDTDPHLSLTHGVNFVMNMTIIVDCAPM